MAFTIVTDTSANLPSELIRKHSIAVIPFPFIVRGEERTCIEPDGFDFSSFYDEMRDGAKVTTSQIPPQQYFEFFEPFLKSGTDVLFIGMSSGISGSFNSAMMAAEGLNAQYKDRLVRCVDTRGASLGEGLQVLRAAELRQEGKSVIEVSDILEAESARMCQIFTVGDLKYLRATGRLSGIAVLVESIIGVKPILKGDESGHIVLAGKARGRGRVIEELTRRYEVYAVEPEKQVVGISHADCRTDAEKLAELIKRRRPPKDTLIVEHEPVTGSHLGPGALALYFMADKTVRYK